MARETESNKHHQEIEKKKEGTGIPSTIADDAMNSDEQLTNEYTKDDNEISSGVRTLHPNRNEDKEDATGAGGYRN